MCLNRPKGFVQEATSLESGLEIKSRPTPTKQTLLQLPLFGAESLEQIQTASPCLSLSAQSVENIEVLESQGFSRALAGFWAAGSPEVRQ